jgi:hypothetical protein
MIALLFFRKLKKLSLICDSTFFKMKEISIVNLPNTITLESNDKPKYIVNIAV